MPNPFLDNDTSSVGKNPFLDTPSAPKSDSDAPRSFFDSMSARAGEGWNALTNPLGDRKPTVPEKDKSAGDFVRRAAAKDIPEGIQAPLKIMGGGMDILTSPAGAAGESIERKAALAAGVNPKAAEKLARDTGDVTKMIPFLPIAKNVPKGAEAIGEAGGKILSKSREAINAGSDAMAKKLPNYPQLSGDEIKALSTDSYAMAAKHGGVLKPELSDKFLNSLNDLIPKGEISQTLSQNRPFMKMIQDLQIAKGKPITLEDAQGIDELLGDAADSHFKPGGMTKEGKKILDIQEKFRDMIADAGEQDIVGGKSGFHAWKDAQFYWSQQAKMHDLEKIVTRANLTDNPVTAMKTGFRNLYLNKKALRGYSDEQKKAIENAAKTGIPSEVLRIVGSRLIPIANVAHGNLGGAATAQAANMAARAAGTRIQLNRANKVAKSISNEVQKRRLQNQAPIPDPQINTGTPLNNVVKQIQP